LITSKCYKIKLLECANFGGIEGIGSIGRVSKTISVHLELEGILSGRDVYTVEPK